MYFLLKNKFKHITILILSCVLLYPLTAYLNHSYYTTISRVNYWEEKTIFSLLEYVVTHVKENEMKNDLSTTLANIHFLGVRIEKNQTVIAEKKIDGLLKESENIQTETFEGYNITITRRLYDNALNDYLYYFSCWLSPSKLFANRTLTTLLGHLVIFLVLELTWLVISIKVRLKQIENKILKGA